MYISSIIIGLIILIFTFYKLQSKIHQKNIKLIQFYLDAKFIYKGLVDSLSISTPSIFYKKMIDQIKDYFDLEDIIIIDSISMIGEESNTAVRAKIIGYIKENYSEINEIVQEYVLSRIDISKDGLDYILYISKLMGRDEGDGLIVCVERFPGIIDPSERAALDNCINLLKTRLYYD